MLEVFLKYFWIIPMMLSVKSVLTLKDELNVKRIVDIIVIGSITFFIATLYEQHILRILGVLIFLYGLILVTYYKFKEGLNTDK